jgi:3-oxoacyl-[acyl-carrier-protein] synthase II
MPRKAMHANPKAKLFISGAAWTTPLGNDLEAVWQRLLEGESGLTRVRGGNRLRNELAAIIAQTPLDRPPMERLVDMAVSTIARALDAAGEHPADASQQLVIGTSLGAYLEDEGWSRPLSAWAESVRSALGRCDSGRLGITSRGCGQDVYLRRR